MKPNQWDDVKEKLDQTGYAVLSADGFEVEVKTIADKLKLVYALKINNKKQKVTGEIDSQEVRRFFQPVSQYVYPVKIRDSELMRADPELKRVNMYYLPWWHSFKSMKAHFLKHNKHIELIKENGHVRDTG